MIIIITMMSGRALKMQKDVYQYLQMTQKHLIPYDTVFYLKCQGKDWKHTRIIWNVSLEQTACIQKEDECNMYTKIKKGHKTKMPQDNAA